jgi:HD-like signal output (HDOD) protein
MALLAPSRPPSGDLATQLVQQLRATEVRIRPYPAVASALERLSRDSRTGLVEVAALVATDNVLAATVLRHAAAVASGASGAPVTLEAAISKLGLDELIRVVIATPVGGAAGAPGPLAVLRRDQWRRSLLAAMLARELAPRRGVVAAQAFVAGLVHDLGAVVVIACLESLALEPLPALPEPTWRRLVEDLHVEFGMVVAARWQLPEPITEVLASHHAPHACMRVHRPVVQLIAIVDQIIEILDRDPGGVAALAEVPGLEHDERYRIGALLPKVAEHMARFEAPVGGEAASAVSRALTALDGGWPAEFAIEGKAGAQYRGCAVAPAMFAFRSSVALPPAWLVELTLSSPPDTITLLACVKSCEPQPGGDYLATAQPFGLAGEDKCAWLRLVGRTRQADSPHP